MEWKEAVRVMEELVAYDRLRAPFSFITSCPYCSTRDVLWSYEQDKTIRCRGSECQREYPLKQEDALAVTVVVGENTAHETVQDAWKRILRG